jgi:hypothetical protein
MDRDTPNLAIGYTSRDPAAGSVLGSRKNNLFPTLRKIFPNHLP